MTVFQPCLQRQTYKGKNEMGGTYFMEKQCYAELW